MGTTTAMGGSSKARSVRSSKSRTPSYRSAKVVVALLGGLSLVAILLQSMWHSPLQPDAADTLFSYNPNDSIESVFRMQSTVQSDRWRYVYIHQSKTAGGNALSLGSSFDGVRDHFIIGNGEGLVDGELQISQLWNHQHPAISPSTYVKVPPNTVSICLVGDFDRKPPTSLQLTRLTQLVLALQDRCRIPAAHIQWLSDGRSSGETSVAALGRFFPTTAFRDQLHSYPTLNP